MTRALNGPASQCWRGSWPSQRCDKPALRCDRSRDSAPSAPGDSPHLPVVGERAALPHRLSKGDSCVQHSKWFDSPNAPRHGAPDLTGSYKVQGNRGRAVVPGAVVRSERRRDERPLGRPGASSTDPAGVGAPGTRARQPPSRTGTGPGRPLPRYVPHWCRKSRDHPRGPVDTCERR